MSLPTCDGQTVICGWEWYQPTTRNGLPNSEASSSAFIVAWTNCSSDISTRSGFLSSRRNITDDTIDTKEPLLWTCNYVQIFIIDYCRIKKMTRLRTLHVRNTKGGLFAWKWHLPANGFEHAFLHYISRNL